MEESVSYEKEINELKATLIKLKLNMDEWTKEIKADINNIKSDITKLQTNSDIDYEEIEQLKTKVKLISRDITILKLKYVIVTQKKNL